MIILTLLLALLGLGPRAEPAIAVVPIRPVVAIHRAVDPTPAPVTVRTVNDADCTPANVQLTPILAGVFPICMRPPKGGEVSVCITYGPGDNWSYGLFDLLACPDSFGRVDPDVLPLDKP